MEALTLALLMLWVFTHNADPAYAAAVPSQDDATVLTDRFNGRADFHDRRGGAEGEGLVEAMGVPSSANF